MVPQETRLQGQILEASSVSWLVTPKIPAPVSQASRHRGWARCGTGQDIPPAGQPTSGEGGYASTCTPFWNLSWPVSPQRLR